MFMRRPACAALLFLAGCVTTRGDGYSGEIGGGVRTIHVEAERFAFDPDEIRVRRGDRVRLVFTSRDTIHGVSIAPYGVREDIPARGKGETVIEFVADKPGAFTYRCSHLCGAGHAMMRGTLVVEDPATPEEG